MAEPSASKPGYYASHPKKYGEFILLQVAKDSDISKATKAKHRLLVENEAFLKYFIGDWLSQDSLYLFPELLQEARLAFLQAVERYDPNRDVSIRTFARFYLLKVKESFFKKQPYVELKEIHLQEECIQPEVDEESLDLRNTLNEAIAQLNPSEQNIFKLHFFEGVKSRAIASARGISEARVSVVIKNGLQKLKEHFIGRGIQPGFFNFN